MEDAWEVEGGLEGRGLRIAAAKEEGGEAADWQDVVTL